VAEAKRLMQAEGLNVSAAAFRVGDNDLSYFSRLFKKLEEPQTERKKSIISGTS
jgi:AraC-like DNA-binding protein